MIEQHPMAWLAEVDGFIVDARTFPQSYRTKPAAAG
jgi:hypothetical protein